MRPRRIAPSCSDPKEFSMQTFLKAAAVAVGLSFIGTAAMACGPDGCGDKAKDNKSECCCCCEKMKGDHAQPGAQKPEAPKPATPKADEHKH
jgi:hypothetical protein